MEQDINITVKQTGPNYNCEYKENCCNPIIVFSIFFFLFLTIFLVFSNETITLLLLLSH